MPVTPRDLKLTDDGIEGTVSIKLAASAVPDSDERKALSDAFAELDSFAELGEQAADSGIDEETYLAASGIDPAEVAAAGADDTDTKSREEVVREAVRELDEPTAEAVVDYGEKRDVPGSYTERALSKLVRSGEASESRGVYRLL